MKNSSKLVIQRHILVLLLFLTALPASARCRVLVPFPTSEQKFALARNVYVAYITGATINMSDELVRNGSHENSLSERMYGSKTLQLVVVDTLKGERADRLTIQWHWCGSGQSALGSKVIAYDGVNFTPYDRPNPWYLEGEHEGKAFTADELKRLPQPAK